MLNYIKKGLNFLDRRKLRCEDCAHEFKGRCYDGLVGPNGRVYYRGVFIPTAPSFGYSKVVRKDLFGICGPFAKDFVSKKEIHRDLKFLKAF